ncbi:MAG: hypothetical protein K0S45_1848 [Nitrospira sp.]|jgi:hypothetical protein|nr:hypothetical protein [Nitrospira sp.]
MWNLACEGMFTDNLQFALDDAVRGLLGLFSLASSAERSVTVATVFDHHQAGNRR